MDLMITLGLSILMVPLAILTDGAPRVVLGLVFVLFLPGYALVAAWFPRTESPSIVERLALSLGLSVAVVPLIGLVLNFTWGVRPYPMLTALLIFIATMCCVALYRRWQITPEQRFDLPLEDLAVWARRSWRSDDRWGKALTLGLVVAVVGTLGMAAYGAANPKAGERFTEFYLLGSDGKADTYPEWLLIGQRTDLIVGIANHEGRTVSYEVGVYINGENAGSVEPLVLGDEEAREEPVHFIPSSVGKEQKVEFRLYRDSVGEPSETLSLWVDVRAVD